MNLNFKLEIKITKDKNGNDFVDISIESKDISNYITKRDELINDKIYIDKPELTLIKLDHNKKLDKIKTALFKELYFIVGKCDIAAARAVKEEMIKINEQQTVRDQEFKLRDQQQVEHIQELNKQIQVLMNRINELESKQK